MTFWGCFAIKTRSKTELRMSYKKENVYSFVRLRLDLWQIILRRLKPGFLANIFCSYMYYLLHGNVFQWSANGHALLFASLSLFFSHTGRIEPLSSRHEKMWFVLTETTNIFSNFIVLPVESLTSENISIKQKKKGFRILTFLFEWFHMHRRSLVYINCTFSLITSDI